MAVPRIPRPAAKLESNAVVFANGRETRLHHFRSLGAESPLVVLLFVDAGFGSIGIEIEGHPCRAEGVGRVVLLPHADGFVEALLADIAPRADCVRNDGYVKVRHCRL